MCSRVLVASCVLFFQAEDGIRDTSVTGVQTCALPISVISTEGSIETLTLKSGHPMLVQAAIDAVKQWKDKPDLLNNEPVEADTEIRVNFTLSPSDTPASANAAPDALQAEATNIKTDSILVPEVVGVVRAMLGQQKIDEALDTVNRALEAQHQSFADPT